MIDVNVHIKDMSGLDNLYNDVLGLRQNQQLGTELAQYLKMEMERYVPKDEGVLIGGAVAHPWYVHYQGPYAHYQFEGVVYGPNFPIIEDGVIVGWRSRHEKHATDRRLQYKKETATHHWHLATVAEKGDVITAKSGEIIGKYLRGTE